MPNIGDPPGMWGRHSLVRHWQIVVRRDDDLAALGEPWSFCEGDIDRESLASDGHEFMTVWVTLAPFPDDGDDRHYMNWGYIGGSSPADLIVNSGPGTMVGADELVAFLRDPAPAIATR